MTLLQLRLIYKHRWEKSVEIFSKNDEKQLTNEKKRTILYKRFDERILFKAL